MQEIIIPSTVTNIGKTDPYPYRPSVEDDTDKDESENVKPSDSDDEIDNSSASEPIIETEGDITSDDIENGDDCVMSDTMQTGEQEEAEGRFDPIIVSELVDILNRYKSDKVRFGYGELGRDNIVFPKPLKVTNDMTFLNYVKFSVRSQSLDDEKNTLLKNKKDDFEEPVKFAYHFNFKAINTDYYKYISLVDNDGEDEYISLLRGNAHDENRLFGLSL